MANQVTLGSRLFVTSTMGIVLLGGVMMMANAVGEMSEARELRSWATAQGG